MDRDWMHVTCKEREAALLAACRKAAPELAVRISRLERMLDGEAGSPVCAHLEDERRHAVAALSAVRDAITEATS